MLALTDRTTSFTSQTGSTYKHTSTHIYVLASTDQTNPLLSKLAQLNYKHTYTRMYVLLASERIAVM